MPSFANVPANVVRKIAAANRRRRSVAVMSAVSRHARDALRENARIVAREMTVKKIKNIVVTAMEFAHSSSNDWRTTPLHRAYMFGPVGSNMYVDGVNVATTENNQNFVHTLVWEVPISFAYACGPGTRGQFRKVRVTFYRDDDDVTIDILGAQNRFVTLVLRGARVYVEGFDSTDDADDAARCERHELASVVRNAAGANLSKQGARELTKLDRRSKVRPRKPRKPRKPPQSNVRRHVIDPSRLAWS